MLYVELKKLMRLGHRYIMELTTLAWLGNHYVCT